MSNIITIAYSTEGTTDKRFLLSIIKRTFDEVAFSCATEIDVYDPIYLRSSNKNGFVENTKELAKRAFTGGIHVLCVLVDADSQNEIFVNQRKIIPAFGAIKAASDDHCKVLVSVVPVTMSEAWMLADKELLILEIGTEKSIEELGLLANPETINDPKQKIIDALRIAQEHISNRRYRLDISELYQPIGQKISLEKLNDLPSYRHFKAGVIDAFKELNYYY